MTFKRVDRGNYHLYFDGDGSKIPSVTTLINQGVPKPALMGWAARLAGEYTADHLDSLVGLDRDGIVDLVSGASRRMNRQATGRGSDVHDLLHRIALGETVTPPPEQAPFVDAYLRFLDDWQPVTVAVEGSVVNRRYRYAGTFDWLGKLRDEWAIVDYKTGASGVFKEVGLQLAAYRAAEAMLVDRREVPMPTTEAGYAVHLRDDGTYSLLPVASGPAEFAAFLHAAHVAAFIARDDVIGGETYPEEIPA